VNAGPGGTAAPGRPRVSIGMPVYNDDRFLPEALDALLGQTFADFELIIADNGSTDGTGRICRDYARRDPRIRYVRHASNLGQAANFEFVLGEAKGEWFMWAASDDRWDRDFVERLLNAATSHPDNIGAFCPYVFTDESGVTLGGPRTFDYSSRSRPWRLAKFCWYYDDGCFYSLFRRDRLGALRIPRWWAMNAGTPYNLAYPVLVHVLSLGNLVLAGSRPMWFNRLKSGDGHFVPFRQSRGRSYAALVARKVNVLVESARSVYRATRSPAAVLGSLPPLAARCVWDCVRPPAAFAAKRLARVVPGVRRP